MMPALRETLRDLPDEEKARKRARERLQKQQQQGQGEQELKQRQAPGDGKETKRKRSTSGASLAAADSEADADLAADSEGKSDAKRALAFPDLKAGRDRDFMPDADETAAMSGTNSAPAPSPPSALPQVRFLCLQPSARV